MVISDQQLLSRDQRNKDFFSSNCIIFDDVSMFACWLGMRASLLIGTNIKYS